MPSTQQSGSSTEYESHHHRMLQEKSKGVILSIKPMTEEDARKWVRACNELSVRGEVVEHFAEQVRRQG